MEIKTLRKGKVRNSSFNIDDFFNNIKCVITDLAPYIDSEIERQKMNLKNIELDIDQKKEEHLVSKKNQIIELNRSIDLLKLKNDLLKTIYKITYNNNIEIEKNSLDKLLSILENIETYSSEELISRNDLLKNTIRRLGI